MTTSTTTTCMDAVMTHILGAYAADLEMVDNQGCHITREHVVHYMRHHRSHCAELMRQVRRWTSGRLMMEIGSRTTWRRTSPFTGTGCRWQVFPSHLSTSTSRRSLATDAGGYSDHLGSRRTASANAQLAVRGAHSAPRTPVLQPGGDRRAHPSFRAARRPRYSHDT